MITIIDYGVGNLASIQNTLNKLGHQSRISDNPAVLKKSNILILPGVGSARAGMKNLQKKNLDAVLFEEINKGKPFLGICLGMQLLFNTSEEGNVKCLGVLKGTVKKFREEKKVPQIGWNEVRPLDDGSRKNNAMWKNIPTNSYFYFVNSYYCKPNDTSIIAGETTYGETFASIAIQDNIVATQFHPEKSGATGFQLLKNFMEVYI